jgi:hypothetical protein
LRKHALTNKLNGTTITHAQGIADTLADNFATKSSDYIYEQEFLSIKIKADMIETEEIF